MNLQRWFSRRDGFADLEHVRPEHKRIGWIEVIGVVLHEARAAAESSRHRLHGAKQRARFPVAFGAKAVSLGHQPLNGQAGELLEAMQIFEGCGESFESAGLKECE